ncbi:MAG TPA: WGxxGxxG family protein [Brevundimonas sp.]|nr:WGxxGxxG family protein [Brevundimonas sp.]
MKNKIIATAAAALFLTAGAAVAQAPAASDDASYQGTAGPAVVEEDDGMDWGWLGLLGLAGLLGLKKRKDEPVRTHPTNTGTTNR